jgi:hypothetical protein
MAFSVGSQLRIWREKLAGILADFRGTGLSEAGRASTLSALDSLLADIQSLPATCMDPDLELGQLPQPHTVYFYLEGVYVFDGTCFLPPPRNFFPLSCYFVLEVKFDSVITKSLS